MDTLFPMPPKKSAKKKKKKKPKKQPGHYCRACGRRRANEKFSGKGHAAHICKDCAKEQRAAARKKRGTVAALRTENNFFADLPTSLPEELIENVFQTEQVRIERIVSTGQSSPPRFWYDQAEGEWVIVLRGEATLQFKDGTTRRRLAPGDYIYIPPHQKHRVFSTSEKQTTVWLAVFVKDSRAKQHWKIRAAILDDIPALKSLYRDTITMVCAADYKADQIQAWAGTIERTDSLAKRIGKQHFYVAESETGEVVGFASFEEPDYLDLMYVHKDFQRLGVGNALLSKIHEKAMEVGTARIVSDVSITARPFFEKNGFKLLKKQTVRIGKVDLTNYKMEKTLMQITVTKKPSKETLDNLGCRSWPIWEKEPSSFPWHYDEQETCLVLEGKVTVTPKGGEPVTFSKGDLVVFPQGMSCTWNVQEAVRKHYKFGE